MEVAGPLGTPLGPDETCLQAGRVPSPTKGRLYCLCSQELNVGSDTPFSSLALPLWVCSCAAATLLAGAAPCVCVCVCVRKHADMRKAPHMAREQEVFPSKEGCQDSAA